MATKTLKDQARSIYSRRVCRQTFIERVEGIGATRGTARIWWQQFKTKRAAASAKA